MKQVKFEWIFVTLIVLILTAYLFLGKPSDDLATAVVMAFVGTVSAATGFIYGKTKPDQ